LLLKLTNEKHLTMNKTYFKISLLFILALLFCGQVRAQSDYKLVEQDSLALVAFYNATDGPNWTSNQEGFSRDDLSTEWQEKYHGGFNNWFDGPAKDWFGVKVEKRPIPNSSDSAYRVTWLWPVIGRRTDGQNGLDGYVPREVGLLTALEDFRVNGNNGFEWTELPDDLYHPTLQQLDIESAWVWKAQNNLLAIVRGLCPLHKRRNRFPYQMESFSKYLPIVGVGIIFFYIFVGDLHRVIGIITLLYTGDGECPVLFPKHA